MRSGAESGPKEYADLQDVAVMTNEQIDPELGKLLNVGDGASAPGT